MKKTLLILAAVLCTLKMNAQEEITKTGLNFGPLPAVAYDQDKGFQMGAILQIYNYGDGTNYPNYNNYWYLEGSYFTKGSLLFTIMNDTKEILPGVRMSSTIQYQKDKAFDFFGFNGYGTSYSTELPSQFYKVERNKLLVKSDLTGDLPHNFKWKVGYHFNHVYQGKLDTEIFAEQTLYDKMYDWGIIKEDEKSGGNSSALWLGLCYDSRNQEGAPSSGIWADATIVMAPKWLGTTSSYYRFSAKWRQYFPIISRNKLTFAYRLMYEGSLSSSSTPYYMLPFALVMGPDNDQDGMGGYNTCRGIIRNRVVGEDMFSGTAELRWRFLQFTAFNQNIALGLSGFVDACQVTRPYDMTFNPDMTKHTVAEAALMKLEYDKYITSEPERLHAAFGAGFRFIMNENFIVAAEYGTPFTHFLKQDNPLYNQDGTGAFYINLGYLF